MKKVVLILFGLALAAAGTSCRQAKTGGHGAWLTDFEKAKQASAKLGKPILADFSGSDWCGWCIKLDREVFSEDTFTQFASENVVLFLADFPQKTAQSDELVQQNQTLLKEYGVQGFPTVLLLDEKGEVLARTGYKPGGADAYVKHLAALLESGG